MYSYTKDGVTISSVLDRRTPNKENKFPIKIKVYHLKKPKYYSTGLTMSSDEWDSINESRTATSKKIRLSIEKSFALVKSNAEELIDKGIFSFSTLNVRLGRASGDTLNSAMRAKIETLKENEQVGTMQFYVNTLTHLEKFAGREISINSVSVEWLQRFEKYLQRVNGVATIGMHFRNIRVIMNVAKRDGIIKESQYPFGRGRFEIKSGEGHKKGLTKGQIKAIFDYESDNEAMMRYKDLWIFIYLCNGINTADLLKLKYSNIIDGEICFVRQKTEKTSKSRKEIRVTITPEMQRIIDKYGNSPLRNNYIFPYLKGDESAIERQKITADVLKRINKRTNLIGKELNIGAVTTYVARHSFATVLKRSGASLSYIQESLGHSDMKTTESYLASFEKEERAKNTELLTSFL